MEKFVKLLKKYDVTFERCLELVQYDLQVTEDNYTIVNVALSSVNEKTYIVGFAVSKYNGGSFQHNYHKYTYLGLEQVLKRD